MSVLFADYCTGILKSTMFSAKYQLFSIFYHFTDLEDKKRRNQAYFGCKIMETFYLEVKLSIHYISSKKICYYIPLHSASKQVQIHSNSESVDSD